MPGEVISVIVFRYFQFSQGQYVTIPGEGHTIMGILGLNSLMGTFGEAVVDQHLINNHSVKRKSKVLFG